MPNDKLQTEIIGSTLDALLPKSLWNNLVTAL